MAPLVGDSVPIMKLGPQKLGPQKLGPQNVPLGFGVHLSSRESQNAGRESLRKLIAKVAKAGPAAKDPRKPACCVTVRRESVAKAILKKPKPAKAKHGVAKASRKGPRKQVYRTAFYTRVFGTAHLMCGDPFWRK